ncbi:MAG: beta-lactamase family protein [Gemmatimonadetes bacterium]|nr:beta-lactamase family protein [Gemmatimonadota bacterium]
MYPTAYFPVRSILAALGTTLLTTTALQGQSLRQVDAAQVDSVFAVFDNTRSPGCAIGVSENGQIVMQRAYGMADLEHDVVNTTQTIFEPGSVSKQITATATVLLALEGTISFDDDIRKYLPELPDYGTPITIRNLLNHDSGLRDWGSVAGIEGWPRTQRAHTNMNVLDILSRQKSLNYKPGDYYSYTNSGYNLQAIIVERVTGESLADFSKERIFKPLGMTQTQWRDDFTRVVKNRSIAYRPNDDGGWNMLMPFEDAYGNGGLLTTVEDLLRFTHNLQTGELLGGPRYVEEMHHQAVLNSGQEFFYASGLQIDTYKGLRQVEHSGSTAGYRGHLARFPDQGLALAVICNASTGNAGGLLHQVADMYLADVLHPADPNARPTGVLTLPADRLSALAGTYRDTRNGWVDEITAGNGGLRFLRRLVFPVSETRFESADGSVTLTFEDRPFADGRPAAVYDAPGSPGVRIEPVAKYSPTPADLGAFTGTYRSDEAEATYTIAVKSGALVLRDRWGRDRSLTPAYLDAFRSGGRYLVFHRDRSGKVTGMSWSESRVWDLRFAKVGA